MPEELDAYLADRRARDLPVPSGGWANVDRIIRPGRVIITSNWDVFVEYYASVRDVPLRLGGEPSEDHLTLIKLHGSVDWTHASVRRSDQPDLDFAALREMQNPRHARTIPVEGEAVLRIRAVENIARSWQFHQGADHSTLDDHDVAWQDR